MRISKYLLGLRPALGVLGALILFMISSSCRAVGQATTQNVTWHPLQKQEREADTMFLLDGDEEAKMKSGEGGGLIAGNESGGRKIDDSVAFVDGKFRKGIKSIRADYGYVWMPAVGIMPADQWTVEYWVRSDAAPESLQDKIALVIYDEHQGAYLECLFHEGSLYLRFHHNQSEAGTTNNVQLRYDLKAHPLAAGDWQNIAYTFKDGTLRWYLNGEMIGEQKDMTTPRIWSDAWRGDGLSIAGGYGRGGLGLSISDLRISRFARTPNEATAISDSSTLTVSGQATGAQINQNLRGALHYFIDEKTGAVGKNLVKVMRTDKMLTSTPIKAGAPDAAHPSKGVSGQYSYDWTVVDRTFDYYKKLGVMPYISIDSTPEILGGKTSPFGEDKLNNPEAKTGWSGFTPEVPNDTKAFGQIVQDFVNHVVKERKENVPYWGVWNEPDGGSFFSTRIEDYLPVYDACAAAVKAVDANLLVGGPETAEYSPRWIEALIKHCAENKTPLDFISWHYYVGDLNEFAHAKIETAAWSKQYGLANAPALINGEWTWQANNLYGTGYPPFSAAHNHLNDLNASFMGASLIEMQRAGVLLSIFTNPVALEKGTSWDSSGLISPDHSWAPGNVFKLWSMMAPNILQTEYSGVPGVWQVASRDGNGRTTIFLSRLAYRKGNAPEVSVKLPDVKAGARVTHYVVDDAHSNAIDAGNDHAELETVAPPKINNGEVKINLKARSVHLLVIEP